MNRETPQVGTKLRASFLPELRSIDLKTRTVDFVASTPEPDRYGDILRPEGFHLENFRKNPVFLFSHKSDEPPIGRCLKVWTEQTPPALCQTIQFADFPFASLIFDLYVQGFMRAISVGFLPLEQPEPITDLEGHFSGYEFKNQDLLESSAVAIPANPSCVARMVSKGFSESDLQRAFSSGEEPVASNPEAIYRELADLNFKLGSAAVDLALKIVRDTLAKAKALGITAQASQGSAEICTVEQLVAAVKQAGDSIRGNEEDLES
jgi:uncharacterized protein